MIRDLMGLSRWQNDVFARIAIEIRFDYQSTGSLSLLVFKLYIKTDRCLIGEMNNVKPIEYLSAKL